MSGICPLHSYLLQHTPSENHFVNTCQCSSSHQVGRIFFGYVLLDDSFCLNPDSLSNNHGPGLRILFTPGHSLSCPHSPSLSRAPPHHSSLPRGIVGTAPFAQNRSPVGRSGTGTS